MKLIDRFTLDDVSAKVWWPLTLVALICLVLLFPAGNRAADEARAEAASRATELSTASIQLAPTLPSTSLPSMVRRSDAGGTRDVLLAYARDPIWSAVRVWSPQFTLWASSVPEEQDEINSGESDNDDALEAARAAGSFSVVTDRLATGGPGPTTFHAYTRIDGIAGGAYITEFEARDSVLLADVHREWLGYRIVGVLVTLVLLGLAIASMREPRARIGTNVPFYPESVPADRAVVELDRAVELDQADERIQDRISGLQERLDESERLRLKAEAQLQQALTALGSGGRSLLAPRAGGAQQAEEGELPTPEPRRAARRVERAEPMAQPKPAAQPKPVTEPKPAAQPKPAARAKPAAAKHPFKQPPSPVTAPQPAVKAPPPPPKRREGKHQPAEPITVSSDDVAVSSGSGTREPEVVVLPEPETARVAARSGGRDSDAEVLDVLNRLVPGPDEPPAADERGDLRARLARTAALKKPGSRERQEQREAAHEEPPQQ